MGIKESAPVRYRILTILDMMSGSGTRWVSPNELGEYCQEQGLYSSRSLTSYSAYVCPHLKKLKQAGYITRNFKGHYRINAIGLNYLKKNAHGQLQERLKAVRAATAERGE